MKVELVSVDAKNKYPIIHNQYLFTIEGPLEGGINWKGTEHVLDIGYGLLDTRGDRPISTPCGHSSGRLNNSESIRRAE